jgi:RNA polymerase sigma factor (sigma-70 family)
MGCSAEAIEAVYRARYVGFCRALWPLVDGAETAQDLVQEGFARALASRRSYRGGSLEAWVWRAIARCAIDAGRRRRRRPAVEASAVPMRERALADLDPALAAAVRDLPLRQRQMVFLRYFAELTQAEIAEACEVQPGTVAATLAQARARLAERLDGVER